MNKGYSKTKDFAVKVNGETVQLDNNNQYRITNIQKDTNITVEGVADITAPDTEIKVSNKTWKSILNTITFGLFFKETQKQKLQLQIKVVGLINTIIMLINQVVKNH